MADEKEMQRKAVEYRMLQERGTALQGQLNALKNLLEEAENASRALQAISSSQEKESALFPLGAGVMVRAKPLETATVLFEQGGGVVLELLSENVLKQLEERKKKLSQAFESYNAELSRLSQRLEELRGELMQYQ